MKTPAAVPKNYALKIGGRGILINAGLPAADGRGALGNHSLAYPGVNF
jgi:hypothetical protein